jgi:hypothetical protein
VNTMPANTMPANTMPTHTMPANTMPATTVEKVKALLAAAQLTVSDDELERFVAVYPTMRAQADSLYLRHLKDEELALGFDPSAPAHDDWSLT